MAADCYLAAVSAPRMDKLVKKLAIDSLSQSQISRMATELHSIAGIRPRPGPGHLARRCGRLRPRRVRSCPVSLPGSTARAWANRLE